jgi:hypothetical protein
MRDLLGGVETEVADLVREEKSRRRVRAGRGR